MLQLRIIILYRNNATNYKQKHWAAFYVGRNLSLIQGKYLTFLKIIKFSITRFHEISFNDSRVLTYGHTD